MRNGGTAKRFGVATLSLLAAAAAAEPLETITVDAERVRLEKQISRFVTELARFSRAEALARWQRPVCPAVAGLPAEQGKYVIARLSQVAGEARIPLAPHECKPNLVVVLTSRPEELLHNWWREQPRLFNKDRGVAEIQREIRTPAPVRVFYNACSVAPGLSRTFGSQGLAGCNSGSLGSRLTWESIRAIYSVIVVVDSRKTAGLAIGPLTDYIAMRALAHIRRDPELGTAPTIMSLFAAPDVAGPTGLSAWDRSFLESLYATDTADVMQVSTITRRMTLKLAR